MQSRHSRSAGRVAAPHSGPGRHRSSIQMRSFVLRASSRRSAPRSGGMEAPRGCCDMTTRTDGPEATRSRCTRPGVALAARRGCHGLCASRRTARPARRARRALPSSTWRLASAKPVRPMVGSRLRANGRTSSKTPSVRKFRLFTSSTTPRAAEPAAQAVRTSSTSQARRHAFSCTSTFDLGRNLQVCPHATRFSSFVHPTGVPESPGGPPCDGASGRSNGVHLKIGTHYNWRRKRRFAAS